MKLHATTKLATIVVAATVALGSVTATAEAATIAPKTSIAINHSVIAVRATAVVSGQVAPTLRNRTVYLQSHTRTGWHSIAHTKLSATSRYSFTMRPGTITKYSLRVYLPTAPGVHNSVSRTITLTTQAKLTCNASMSNARPTQYAKTHVLIRTAGSAAVTTIAHYKTTNTRHTAKANPAGRADITYYTAGATHNRKVVVSVTVRKSPQTATCSTSFTTR